MHCISMKICAGWVEKMHPFQHKWGHFINRKVKFLKHFLDEYIDKLKHQCLFNKVKNHKHCWHYFSQNIWMPHKEKTGFGKRALWQRLQQQQNSFESHIGA